MSQLQYRMVSGSNPKGRQKVWFCCHPEDFSLYFDLICDDIFSTDENCAVFYESDPLGDYDRDDLLLHLEEMQLIVIPVTRKLLTRPSRAMELEIPFALGRVPAKDGTRIHIPVLPILLEGALDKMFNESPVFSGLQFLDRYTKDDSAHSYEEKLSTFLTSVLVSSEERDRILAHFRAGIFLSYRKMDRALARWLMKQIHNMDFCRDVSIWYDEYLVPGENWDDAISSELSACDLFVLNVTPELLTDGNYVFDNEYPAALRQEKPILPVMTKATSIKEWKEKYTKIADLLVSSGNAKGLEQGLLRGLVEAAGKENLLTPDNNAEHLYYIGLAYRSGTGLESDPARAVSLLETAGEKGCRKAWLTLGFMHEKGFGVPVDPEKAIVYYDRFIALQSPDFGTSHQGDLDLLLAYDAKGMIYLHRSRLKEAFDTYLELARLLESMTSCFGDFKQVNLPVCYERLAAIKKSMGDIPTAREYLGKAMDVQQHPPVTRDIATPAEKEAARKKSTDPKMKARQMRGPAVTLHSMGEICLLNQDLFTAGTYFFRANKLFAEIAEKDGSRDNLFYLSKSHLGIAGYYMAARNFRKAEEFLQKALDILETLYKNPKDREARVYHAVTLDRLSVVYRERKLLQKAESVLNTALEEAEDIFRTDRSPEVLDLLGTLYERKGILAEEMGQDALARRYYEKELAFTERLAGETESAEQKRSLAIACEHLAKLLVKNRDCTQDDYALAVSCIRKDLEITRGLAGDEANIQARTDLYVCLDAAYQVHRYHEPEKALEYAVRGLQVCYRVAENVRQPQNLFELGDSYYCAGLLCADISQRCFTIALALLRRAYRKLPSVDIAGRIDAIRELMQKTDHAFPLGPGYCSSLNELAQKWPEGNPEDANYEIISPVVCGNRGTGGNSPVRVGGLRLLIMLAVVVCGILQVTGRADIAGFLVEKLGRTGFTIALGILLAYEFYPFVKKK